MLQVVRGLAWVVLVAAFAVVPAAAEPATDPQSPRDTREVMRGIFAAFVTLMARADSADRFADPA